MLAVDAGNSNTRFVRFADGTIQARRTLPTAELVAEAAVDALAAIGVDAAGSQLWIATVVPSATKTLVAAAAAARMNARIIVPGVDEIIPHDLLAPESTGVDRLLSARAAGTLTGDKRDYLIIQCGSAATVDLVEGGVFRGGFILPGPKLWLSAMGKAAQLPDLSDAELDWETGEPGRSTREALLHGVAAGLPGAVSNAARLLGGGTPKPAVVTGGWGEYMARQLGSNSVYFPDLVLLGIHSFAASMVV
ncbi:MAG: type III pantothenate kinase [Planctomycetota bacterium]|jgi:type III pantothenate kinase|nr:type III pantothenate kinase [Planctomycetota bacterium]